MRAKAIAQRAEAYARTEQWGPAEGLLGVLVDLFSTGSGNRPAVNSGAVREAWNRLTRRLDERLRLHEQLVLLQGIDVLAANLTEARQPELAALARDLFPPAVQFPAGRSAPEPPLPVYAGDTPLWTPAAT